MSSTTTAREAALVPVTWTVAIGPEETPKEIELTTHVPDSPLATEQALIGKGHDKLAERYPDARFVTGEVGER